MRATTATVKTFAWRPSRLAVGLAIIAAAALATWYAIWQHVRPAVLGSSEYLLALDQIQITPSPDWIKADVRAEAFRAAGIEGPLSILDEDLALRIDQAFRVHPWVANVERVTKRPATVALVYRRPVCMVQVEGGVFPVDREGVLLPSDDFSKTQARAYPLLAGIKSLPSGPAGTLWGDHGVSGGARLAALLSDDWVRLRLQRMVAVEQVSSADERSEIHYEIYSRSGTQIKWGRAPAAGGKTDASSAEKLAWLRKYAGENQSLDAADGPQEIDLRDAQRATARRRAGIRALPAEEPQ